MDRRVDRGQQPNALDARVGADATCRLLDRAYRMRRLGVDGNPAKLLRYLQAQSTMSMTNVLAGPKSCAHIVAIKPTGPAPTTATTSPALISARSAPKKPVARMS